MGTSFATAKKAAGREDLKWHDLRHTGATMVAQVGATTAELQARLGNSTSVAAQLYQHAKDRHRQIAERLSRLIEDELLTGSRPSRRPRRRPAWFCRFLTPLFASAGVACLRLQLADFSDPGLVRTR